MSGDSRYSDYRRSRGLTWAVDRPTTSRRRGGLDSGSASHRAGVGGRATPTLGKLLLSGRPAAASVSPARPRCAHNTSVDEPRPERVISVVRRLS
ncbi:hypothetical protein ACFPM0_06985 [Pseudonocardia sulfidoxydans]|uniref:hypothetical protein n=1 Tax=Pseudonocardia sulfidoxydans TaxID=54011 RepID=UPI00361FFD24